jgi:hypothetical protein
MSSKDLKNRILEKLSNTIQGGNNYMDLYKDDDYNIASAVKIGGASVGGALVGGNKEIIKKLKQQTAPNLRKLILSKNIRGVTKMSKKELVDVIMQNIDRFPEVHKLKNKPKKQLSEAEKQVLRDRLAKARSMKKKGKSKTAKKIKVEEVDSEEEDDIISVLQDEDKFKQFEEDKNLYEHLFSKKPKAQKENEEEIIQKLNINEYINKNFSFIKKLLSLRGNKRDYYAEGVKYIQLQTSRKRGIYDSEQKIKNFKELDNFIINKLVVFTIQRLKFNTKDTNLPDKIKSKIPNNIIIKYPLIQKALQNLNKKIEDNRENLLKKMKVADLRKILKIGGIEGYSKVPKSILIETILNNPQIYGGNFFDTLKSIGSTLLDVGKVVGPFVPLLL